VGYDMFGEKNDYNILTVGAGGIYSTVEDLFKWDQALYTEKLIKQSTLKEAFTPCKLNNGKKSNYGFGWGIQKSRKGKIVGHAGGLAGFRTYIERQLKKKNTIILLTNNGNSKLPSIRKAIANILKDKHFDFPKISIASSLHHTIKTVGINAAIRQYYDLKEKKSNRNRYNFNEFELNILGYHLLEKNKFKEALEIFKLNVKEYPNSWNVYDSLGEAYMKSGNTKRAIKNYKRSVQINPKSRSGIEALKKLEALETNQSSE
jgi:tetratricopeptide (TPR) repeat protein